MTNTEIRIDVNKLIASKLTLEEYFMLMLVWHKDYTSLEKFANYHYPNGVGVLYPIVIRNLEEAGWIKIVGTNLFTDIEIRETFIELFKPSDLERRLEEVPIWINKYRDIFRGRKQGAMGDPNACMQKMRRFITQYPQYTVEQILKATQLYVDSQGPRYTFLQQADYFISKQGTSDKIATSRLLTYLEDLDTAMIEEQGTSTREA